MLTKTQVQQIRTRLDHLMHDTSPRCAAIVDERSQIIAIKGRSREAEEEMVELIEEAVARVGSRPQTYSAKAFYPIAQGDKSTAAYYHLFNPSWMLVVSFGPATDKPQIRTWCARAARTFAPLFANPTQDKHVA